MPQRILNLGILAHVDAGKTTLTERLLYTAGVIDRPGTVDAGTTHTDSLALERARGITIKSAVVSFVVGDTKINLIDTPGHPDFIAEVERVLGVLDGAVLVISAVEGVQPQTRIHMRALKRIGTPALLFVNKIDRGGASTERTVEMIRRRLGVPIAEIGIASDLGTGDARVDHLPMDDRAWRSQLIEAAAEHDEDVLAAYLDGGGDVAAAGHPLSREGLLGVLARQSRGASVHPVFYGSARTGAGVPELLSSITQFLPAAVTGGGDSLAGSVFKVERGSRGQRLAYIRLFSGTLRVRDRFGVGRRAKGKVTGLDIFENGVAISAPAAKAGDIARVSGLDGIRIGDAIGSAGPAAGEQKTHHFAPPTQQAAVVPVRSADGARLRAALAELAEQDPLINVSQDNATGELTASLYGEVQREVIQATLLGDYGLEVAFGEPSTICIERPRSVGSALAVLQSVSHPYSATVGLRIDPAPAGSGLDCRLDVDPQLVPIYIYKTAAKFTEAMTSYVSDAFASGLRGWRVTDCVVTMTDCNYYIGDGPAKPVGATPRTTARHFRKLTPLVLRHALERAGTFVCEPMLRVRVEAPASSVGDLVGAIARMGGVPEERSTHGDLTVIECVLATAAAQALCRQVPHLTGGEGVVESDFHSYRPIRGHDGPHRREVVVKRNLE